MTSDVLTLEESIKIALERSLSIKSAKEEIKAREFEERSAKADFFPKFSTSYSYTRLDEDTVNDAKYTLGSSEYSPLTTDTYEFNVTGTQPLFTGWALTISWELASLGIDTAKVQKEIVIQDLVLNVKGAYFGILKAKKLEKVAYQAV